MMHDQTEKHDDSYHSETAQALRAGYYHLLERLYARMMEQERHSDKNLDSAIQAEAEQLATEDESDRHHLADALREDLRHARELLYLESAPIRDTWRKWRGEAGEKLLSLADRTDLTLEQIREEAERHRTREWATGHVTSPKRLACVDCGETLNHQHYGPLPKCPNCGGKFFKRA